MVSVSAAGASSLSLPASSDLVRRFVQLTAQRRALEEQLAFLRGELELAAASLLSEACPRGRFEGVEGPFVLSASLRPTCVFDRVVVAQELQRMGRLAEVATLQGPGVARYLAREPVVAARLGSLVRMRHSVVLTVGEG